MGIKFIEPSVKLFEPTETVDVKQPNEKEAIWTIGLAAGTAYSSKTDWEAVFKRTRHCITRGHHSVLEHVNLTLEIVTDRGTSHALVRHRHCAFTQSSTIYQKSQDDITIISFPKDTKYASLNELNEVLYNIIQKQYDTIVADYHYPPSVARDVLPNAYATKLIMTTNLREWYYIAQRRTASNGDAPRMWVFDEQLKAVLAAQYPYITEWMFEWQNNHPL